MAETKVILSSTCSKQVQIQLARDMHSKSFLSRTWQMLKSFSHKSYEHSENRKPHERYQSYAQMNPNHMLTHETNSTDQELLILRIMRIFIKGWLRLGMDIIFQGKGITKVILKT